MMFLQCATHLLSFQTSTGKEKSEMTTEAIFWYIIRTLSGIVSVFTAYTVLKYLSKKTLAMKTIFDEIIKEFIYLKKIKQKGILTKCK